MPEFRVSVDAETADALQTETDLLGFGSTDEYLAWIVDHRAAIDQGTEARALLESYRDRIQELEAHLDEAKSNATGGPSSEPATDGPEATTAPGTTTGPGTTTDAAEADAGNGTSGRPVAIGGPTVTRVPSDDGAADATGGTTGGTVDVATTDEASDSATAHRAPTASDGGTRAEAEITSMHLQPERVQRVSEDPVTDDADELADVETRRIEALQRRVEARDESSDDAPAGQEYRSSRPIPDADVRPGSRIVDLDDLEVPGRSDEVVETRRAVAGRALSFLEANERARRSDFVDAFYDAHPAGYETADGWWRFVRSALAQVDAVDGGRVWEYEG